MNNGNVDVMEMEKNPNAMFDVNSQPSDDFYDDDLVNMDFTGLDVDANEGNTQNFTPVQVDDVEDDGVVIEEAEPVNDFVAPVNPEPVYTYEAAPVVNTEMPTYNNVMYAEPEEIAAPVTNIEPENNSIDTKIEDNSLVNKGEVSFEIPTLENKKNLDNSYVLSNFDVLFDSLYSDVVGANNFITDLMEKKSTLNKDEQLLTDFKEKFEKEKEDFRNFVEVQKRAIENEKNQASVFIESKRARLHGEETKFHEDVEAKQKEFALLEESLKLEREKFESEKANFEEQKGIDLRQIETEREKLRRDIEQFEVDKKLAEENLNASKKDLQVQQEQFARYKELEHKKMDLEEKNLSQSCARFKELVSQFNSGFEQLPNNNN